MKTQLKPVLPGDVVGAEIDKLRLHLVVRRPARVAGKFRLRPDALRRSQGRQEPQHRVERRQLRQLVEIKPGKAPALIVGRIGFAFEVAAI